MKNLERVHGTTLLTDHELLHIDGGEDAAPPKSFWYDLGYYGMILIKGLIVFAEEGGRNAGTPVR